jgi:hypothetical protein
MAGLGNLWMLMKHIVIERIYAPDESNIIPQCIVHPQVSKLQPPILDATNSTSSVTQPLGVTRAWWAPQHQRSLRMTSWHDISAAQMLPCDHCA